MNRRHFGQALISSGLGVALPAWASSGRARSGSFFNAVGGRIFHSRLDLTSGALTPLGCLILPSAIQYAWFHPRASLLYTATGHASAGSDGGYRLCAIRIARDGSLNLFGEPAILAQRPVHVSLDHRGRLAFVSHTAQPYITVIRINQDGTPGEAIVQSQVGSFGFYPHQARMLPDGNSLAIVCRGSDPRYGKGEEPGSLLQFALNDGRLNLLNVLTEGDHGFGYGPRHLDFHPRHPWLYVAVERQNQLHMHYISGRGLIEKARFISQTTSDGVPGASQAAGAIHVHPRGHVVYVSNRSTGPIDQRHTPERPIGENSIAVFAIDPRNGEPRLIQTARVPGISPRSFSVDPSGTVLVAATMQDTCPAEGGGSRTGPGRLHLYRIAENGSLDFIGSQGVSLLPDERQMWCAFGARK